MPVNQILRQTVYQAEKAEQRLRFRSVPAPERGWPVLLGISFPKSGTHLLDQILLGFARVAPFSKRLHSFYAEYEGESGHKRSPGQALSIAASDAKRGRFSARKCANGACARTRRALPGTTSPMSSFII